jgi:hypothetical protein
MQAAPRAGTARGCSSHACAARVLRDCKAAARYSGDSAPTSKIFTLFEGTSEIQRMLIGRTVTGLDIRQSDLRIYLACTRELGRSALGLTGPFLCPVCPERARRPVLGPACRRRVVCRPGLLKDVEQVAGRLAELGVGWLAFSREGRGCGLGR